MNEPEWLSLAIVLDAHAEILARFGGKDGLRDVNLLESALARPENKFRDGERDLGARVFDPEAKEDQHRQQLANEIIVERRKELAPK